MTIYIDHLTVRTDEYRGRRRHKASGRMFTDPTDDLSALTGFAAFLGVPRTKLHRTVMPHYDLTPRKREEAKMKGAVLISSARARDIEAAWRRFWDDKV